MLNACLGGLPPEQQQTASSQQVSKPMPIFKAFSKTKNCRITLDFHFIKM
jgi:hypothetical protein